MRFSSRSSHETRPGAKQSLSHNEQLQWQVKQQPYLQPEPTLGPAPCLSSGRVRVTRLLLLKPSSRLERLTDAGENNEGLDAEESKGRARRMEITSDGVTAPRRTPFNPVRGLPGSQRSGTRLPAPGRWRPRVQTGCWGEGWCVSVIQLHSRSNH